MDRTESAQGSTKEPSGNGFDMFSEATSRVKQDVEDLIEGFDLQAVTKRVEEFGKQNPVGLALTALALGVAVGMFMKNPNRIQRQ